MAGVSFLRLVCGPRRRPHLVGAAKRAGALAHLLLFDHPTAHSEHPGGAEVSAYGGFVVCIVKQGSVVMRDKLGSV